MESITAYSEAEPTLRDVSISVIRLTENVTELTATVNDVVEVMKDGFGSMEIRMDALYDRMNGFESKVDCLENTAETGFHEVNRRLGNLESVVEDMRETLEATALAVDRDAITSIDHEHRIGLLEEVP